MVLISKSFFSPCCTAAYNLSVPLPTKLHFNPSLYPCVFCDATIAVWIKTYLSHCGEWMEEIWVTYGGPWRRTLGSFLNRWENRPAGILRFKEWTTTVIGGAPVGTIASLSPTTRGCARELVCRLPRHRAIPLTALPGGIGRGGSGVCVCSITGHNFYRHNHTTDA